MALIGIALALLGLIGTPIALIYRFPDRIEAIVIGWLLVMVAVIAAMLYWLFRKRAHGGTP
jgi:O-antigen/teichoic acid export membrane protein